MLGNALSMTNLERIFLLEIIRGVADEGLIRRGAHVFFSRRRSSESIFAEVRPAIFWKAHTSDCEQSPRISTYCFSIRIHCKAGPESKASYRL